MAHRFAGQYGPATFSDLAGNVDTGLVVTVRLQGVATLAGLFTTRTRTAGLANPLPSGVPVGAPGIDVHGNVIFFADPGTYDVTVEFDPGVARVYPLVVPVDPAETESERTERTNQDAALNTAVSTGDAATLAEAQVYARSVVVPTVYRGEWDALLAYVRGDRVAYQGSSYDARGSIAAGVVPGTAPESWQLNSSAASLGTIPDRVTSLEGRTTTAETAIAGHDTRITDAQATATAAQAEAALAMRTVLDTIARIDQTITYGRWGP